MTSFDNLGHRCNPTLIKTGVNMYICFTFIYLSLFHKKKKKEKEKEKKKEEEEKIRPKSWVFVKIKKTQL